MQASAGFPIDGNETANELLLRMIDRLNETGDDFCYRASGFLWTLIEPRPTVSTCLGETRQAESFAANGDYFCPFCQNPVWRSKGEKTCQNPWCDAHPNYTPETLRARQEKRAAEEAEKARRQRDHEWGLKWRAEQEEARRTWQAEQIAEARKRGACLNYRCLFPRHHEAKFIRHRGPCPNEGRY